MTVAELIEQLQMYGDDLIVLMDNQEGILCDVLVSKGNGYIRLEPGKVKE
jgi:hypothetical protein